MPRNSVARGPSRSSAPNLSSSSSHGRCSQRSSEHQLRALSKSRIQDALWESIIDMCHDKECLILLTWVYWHLNPLRVIRLYHVLKWDQKIQLNIVNRASFEYRHRLLMNWYWVTIVTRVSSTTISVTINSIRGKRNISFFLLGAHIENIWIEFETVNTYLNLMNNIPRYFWNLKDFEFKMIYKRIGHYIIIVDSAIINEIVEVLIIRNEKKNKESTVKKKDFSIIFEFLDRFLNDGTQFIFLFHWFWMIISDMYDQFLNYDLRRYDKILL